jgi:arsenite methyltransferase
MQISPANSDSVQASVRSYYGESLSSSNDLQTNACCPIDSLQEEVKQLLPLIHPEVLERFYGCGSPIPPMLDGLTVLDLGCGTGRDSYVLSKLVGESGSVIGVDMTEQQITIAQKHQEYHRLAFGHARSNTSFRKGLIEDLSLVGIADNSIDLVVSNCVINLSANKEAVFREIFRVLKPGGELYFSDVFADRRIPLALQQDPILLGECLSGALYTEDFRRLLAKNDCLDFRVCAGRPITIGNKAIEEKLGMIQFSSVTVRAFKLDLEDRCEDYGQIAIYKGTLPGHLHSFNLDQEHTFVTDKPSLVCSNTAAMLELTRFAPHFTLIGDTKQHFGIFDCAPTAQSTSGTVGSCC